MKRINKTHQISQNSNSHFFSLVIQSWYWEIGNIGGGRNSWALWKKEWVDVFWTYFIQPSHTINPAKNLLVRRKHYNLAKNDNYADQFENYMKRWRESSQYLVIFGSKRNSKNTRTSRTNWNHWLYPFKLPVWNLMWCQERQVVYEKGSWHSQPCPWQIINGSSRLPKFG